MESGAGHRIKEHLRNIIILCQKIAHLSAVRPYQKPGECYRYAGYYLGIVGESSGMQATEELIVAPDSAMQKEQCKKILPAHCKPSGVVAFDRRRSLARRTFGRNQKAASTTERESVTEKAVSRTSPGWGIFPAIAGIGWRPSMLRMLRLNNKPLIWLSLTPQQAGMHACD